MQPVRVFAEPVVKFFLPGFARNVADVAAVSVVFARFQDLVTDRCGHAASCASPTATLCRAASLCCIGVGKRLQAGNIAGECKFAVADRERRERIDFSQDRIVTRDKSEAVYRFASFLTGDRADANAPAAARPPINSRRVIFGSFISDAMNRILLRRSQASFCRPCSPPTADREHRRSRQYFRRRRGSSRPPVSSIFTAFP